MHRYVRRVAVLVLGLLLRGAVAAAQTYPGNPTPNQLIAYCEAEWNAVTGNGYMDISGWNFAANFLGASTEDLRSSGWLADIVRRHEGGRLAAGPPLRAFADCLARGVLAGRNGTFRTPSMTVRTRIDNNPMGRQDPIGPSDASTAAPPKPAPAPPPPPKPAPKPASAAALDDILKGMDPSKNDPRQCRAAIAYVESPDGLLGEYDRAVAKADIRRAYEQQLLALKKDLLDDTWWERSVGADIAREVKFLSDVIVQTYAMFTPAGKVIEEASGAPGWYLENYFGTTETQIFDKLSLGKAVLDAVSLGDKAAKTVKSAYDSRESLEAAARSAGATVTELAAEELLKRGLAKASARLFPAYKILKAVYTRAKTVEQAREFKATVQEQLGKIEAALAGVQVQIATERKTVRAINDIKDTVTRLCSQGPGK